MNTNNNKWDETVEREWRAFRDRFEVGQPIEGVVVRDAPFGLFVDIGHPRFPALAKWVSDDLRGIARPAPGHLLKGVVTDFSDQQIRLWAHPSALRAADVLQQASILPPEERETFLRRALLSQEPYMAQVAVWYVRYLPLHKRGAFLRQALHLNHDGVAALAVGRVVDLPQEEQAPFLQHVVQHEDQGVATLAVWKARHISTRERRIFLQEAVQHPFRAICERARFELEHLSSDEPLDE